VTLFEDWVSVGLSTSRPVDVFEGGLWCGGEGIFFGLEVAIAPGAYVSSGGDWYECVKRPL